MKILLCQLGIPRLDPLEYKANIPLGTAYIQSFVNNPRHEIVLMPRALNDVLCEEAVLQFIIETRPDIVGFTLCLWNIVKTLRIAEQLRRIEPGIRCVFGGPEVHPENRLLTASPAFETGFVSEGEIPFSAWLDGDCRNPVPGMVVRTGNRLTATQASRKRCDIPVATHPLLRGAVDLTPDDCLYFETTRGCPFRCAFCHYNKCYDKTSAIGDDTLRSLFRLAAEQGFSEIFLLDPSLNAQAGFDEQLRQMIDFNVGTLPIATELRADLLTDPQIAGLLKLGLHDAEIGLQSTNPVALARMNRQQNLDRLTANTRRLIDAGVRCKVDLIIGLPGDTPDGFRRSVDYVCRHGLVSEPQVFQLSVLPGTDFADNASSLGLSHSPMPPYYIVTTPTFSEEDIRDCYRYAADCFELEFDPVPDPLLSTDFDTIPEGVSFGDIQPVHKLLFVTRTEGWETYLPRLAENATLHIILRRNGISPTAVNRLLRDITHRMPHNCHEIIIDSDVPLHDDLLYRITEGIHIDPGHYVNLDAEPFLGQKAIVSTRLVIVQSAHLLPVPGLPERLRQWGRVFFRTDRLTVDNTAALHRDGFDLLVTGPIQEPLFCRYMENDDSTEGLIFDSIDLEFARRKHIEPEKRLYRPGIFRL